MCGIIGYIGNKQAHSIVLQGLKKLEYRGYDSAGILLSNGNSFKLFKSEGNVSNLEKKIFGCGKDYNVGIGHTRWATHGEPNEINSHPHVSNDGVINLVHNGIIENYQYLKSILLKEGFNFYSKTDTEILVNFIQYVKNKNNLNIYDAVRFSLTEVIGAYALCIIDKNEPNKIIFARLGSPLLVGVGDHELFISSDPSPFLNFTKNVIYIEDGEIGYISFDSKYSINKIKDNSIVNVKIEEVNIDAKSIQMNGYDSFMIKEINEQYKSIIDTLRGRLNVDNISIKMSGIDDNLSIFLNAKKIIIVGCGTSYHAGLIGEYLIESLAKVPVEVEYASEFRYRNPIINSDDVVIAISQSGETADTLEAIKLAKSKGVFIFGINNCVGSSIARLTDAGAYTHAGPEIGVASTKAFTTQLVILSLIALKLGKENGNIDKKKFISLIKEMDKLPYIIKNTINSINDDVEILADKYSESLNFIYMGRGYNYPSALEGALKLKEISYIHAEGYPAGEMKHGPIALLDKNMPVLIIAVNNSNYKKIISNINEIKARGARVISIVNNNNNIDAIRLSDDCIIIPEILEELSPILVAIPLQLFSYWIAKKLGRNVDQPRNLAKSVTVE